MDEAEFRKGVYQLLEESEFRRKHEQHEIPTAFDKSMWQLAVLLAKLDPATAWQESAKAIPGAEGVYVREALGVLKGLLAHRGAGRYVDYDARLRRSGCDMSPSILAMSSGVAKSVTWRDMPLFKTAYDMAIYPTLLWELKPTLIVEIGSGTGASAIWLADLMRMFGIEGRVVSFDCQKLDISYDRVRYLQGDCRRIAQDFDRSVVLENHGPILLLEDAHVNVAGVLEYFHPLLKQGDYVVVEDSLAKREPLLEWLGKCQNAYQVDTRYVDLFGCNVTTAQDSIFRRMR
ncbi:CmcI family methyltransferase [Dyella flagellata]|nr:CmcI family methyltransferase [Dyella flagellata]